MLSFHGLTGLFFLEMASDSVRCSVTRRREGCCSPRGRAGKVRGVDVTCSKAGYFTPKSALSCWFCSAASQTPGLCEVEPRGIDLLETAHSGVKI